MEGTTVGGEYRYRGVGKISSALDMLSFRCSCEWRHPAVRREGWAKYIELEIISIQRKGNYIYLSIYLHLYLYLYSVRGEIMSGAVAALTDYLLKVVEWKPFGEIQDEDKEPVGHPFFSTL